MIASWYHTAKHGDLEAVSQDLFGILLSGHVKIWVIQRYALSEAAQTHLELEVRILFFLSALPC
jgi:hypothetical protein